MNDFLADFKVLFFSRTSKDSGILFGGTILSTILNLILTIILGRNLAVSDLGLFLTGLTFVSLLTDGFELGINSAVLNFLPKESGNDASKTIKESLFLKLIIGFSVMALVLLFGEEIASLIFKDRAILEIIKLSSLGIFLLMLVFWGQTIFQAKKDFFSSMGANTLINVFRTLIIFILVWLGFKNVNLLFLFAQISLLGCLVFIFFQSKFEFLKVKVKASDMRKLLRFGLPVGIGFAIAAIYTRLDQILVFNLSGAKEAGVYGLAQRLSTFFVFASSSFSSAFIPRFSSISNEDFEIYFKKTIKGSLTLLILPLISIPISSIILPILFEKYQSSILPFQVLCLGICFFILSSPFLSAILYRFKKTKFSFLMSFGSLILIFLSLNLLIPKFQSTGAAISVSTIYFLQFLASIIYFKILKSG